MHPAMHPAFQQRIAEVAELLERTKAARDEAHTSIGWSAPLFQAAYKGGDWDVVEIATGLAHGFAFKYPAAMKFVDALEAAETRKLVGRQ